MLIFESMNVTEKGIAAQRRRTNMPNTIERKTGHACWQGTTPLPVR
jgi:hypothetical protein